MPILVVTLLTGCQKQIPTHKPSEEVSLSKQDQLNEFSTVENLKRGCSPATIKICDQNWMVKNLDVTTYSNGDRIPQVTDPSAWAALTTGAWCYYENSSANRRIYGKLYNWYAVHDSRGLAPRGWHIPADAEWDNVLNCLGGYELAGGAMKETGTAHWATPNTGATNSSGFTALPGAARDEAGLFVNIGFEGIWWSASESNSTSAFYRNIIFSAGNLGRGITSKRIGASVRCVKN